MYNNISFYIRNFVALSLELYFIAVIKGHSTFHG